MNFRGLNAEIYHAHQGTPRDSMGAPIEQERHEFGVGDMAIACHQTFASAVMNDEHLTEQIEEELKQSLDRATFLDDFKLGIIMDLATEAWEKDMIEAYKEELG